MENLKELNQNNDLNKLVGNIIASAVIDSEEIPLIFKKFFDIKMEGKGYKNYILINSCVIKLNNNITIKVSITVDNIFYSLPILNIIENDLNTFIDYSNDEINYFTNKLIEIVNYIINS